MATYTGPAELIPLDGGSPFSADVQLHSFKRGYLKDWAGHGTAQGDDFFPVETGKYTIRLPNGSEGTIFVSNVSMDGDRVDVTLLGSGPAPF